MTTDSVFTNVEPEFSTAVFHALTRDEEREVLSVLQKRHQDVGDAAAAPPLHHELFSVTTRLIAPTLDAFGTEAQRVRFVDAFRRAEILCCQLFSEPTAGSDLAGLATRAEPDGAEWVVNGQKVWSSGAGLADWGLLIARSDPDLPKHAGMTAFLVPMNAPGIEIRPIRQMSGGASFNEVFLTDVRVPDAQRVGEVGQGWRVALTTLGFERDHTETGDELQPGGTWDQVLITARALGRVGEPLMRQALANLYVRVRVEALTNQRAAGTRHWRGPRGFTGQIALDRRNAAHVRRRVVVGRPRAGGRHGRVRDLRVERARPGSARLPHRRWRGRDPAEHSRRAGAGFARGTAGRQRHPLAGGATFARVTMTAMATEQYDLPTPGTVRGQRTRERILAAAEDVFGELGYEPASIAAITQTAGVAQGTFYVYFPSKHAIFVELIKDFGVRVRAAIAQATVVASAKPAPRAEVERAGLEAWLGFCFDHPGLYRVMREAAIVAPETHRGYYESFVGAYVDHFKQWSTGSSAVRDAETLAYVMVGIGDWIGLRWTIWEGKRPPKRVLDQITALLDGGFAGLTTAPKRAASA